MAKIIAVCKSSEEGARKKSVAEGIFREESSMVGYSRKDACQSVRRIATDEKQRH
jgi:hypothetical protein